MIPFSAGMITELNKRGATRDWRYFFEFHFKSGVERYWTGMRAISWNGQTWGRLTDVVETIGEHAQTSAGDFESISIGLMIVDPARLIQVLAADEIEERRIRMYKGIYDRIAGTMLPDPYMVWDRTMRSGPYDGQSRRWTLLAESPFKAALFRVARIRAHADQKAWAAALGEANDEGLIDVTAYPQARRAWPGESFELRRSIGD